MYHRTIHDTARRKMDPRPRAWLRADDARAFVDCLRGRWPWLVDGADESVIDLRPIDVPGCAFGRLGALVVAGVPRAVLRLRRDDPAATELYPLHWSTKPGVIPMSALAFDSALDESACQGATCVELGTGDFALPGLFAAWRGSRLVVGLEICPERAANAARAVRLVGFERRMSVVRGDWYAPLRHGRADLVLANPPYEPVPAGASATRADDGGEDGRRHLDQIIDEATTCLRPGGRLLLHQATFLGVDEGTGTSPSTFERLQRHGFRASVALRAWRPMNTHMAAQVDAIHRQYPGTRIRRWGGRVWYETVIVDAIAPGA